MKNSEYITVATKAKAPQSKVDRYKWTKADAPGEFVWIDKNELHVDHTYQRDDPSAAKILRMASNWSWIGCSAICVAMRERDYLVMDGQHRVLAARRRSDITKLPCMVFETRGVADEANGFLMANVERKPMLSLDKFKARVVGRDDLALFVNDVISNLGITLSRHPGKQRQTKAIDAMLRVAQIDRQSFIRVMEVSAELCDGIAAIPAAIILGLRKVDASCCQVDDSRLKCRLIDVGILALMDAVRRAQLFHDKGGELVYAQAIIGEVNKGLRKKYEIRTRAAE